MKKTNQFIFGLSFIFISVSTSALTFKSSDFSPDNDDSYDESGYKKGPWRMSSGTWKTQPWGGGPFNMDTRSWRGAPWNWGSTRSPWGGRNSPWGSRNAPWGNSSPWNWNSNDWSGNRAPWSSPYPGYGNPYYRAPYGAPPYGNWYGDPYNSVPTPTPEMPYVPKMPSTSGQSNEGK